MRKRLGTFVVVGLIGVLALVACGTEDEKIEPTVTRIPAEGAPVLTPTSAPTEETQASPASAASPSAVASPVVSPVAETATTEASPVAEENPPAATAAASPVAAASPAAGSPVASPAAVVFEVDLEDIKFSPNALTIPANTDVTIELKTTGVAGHDFVIDELGIKTSTMLQGQSETITINAPAGTYQFYCSTPGHKEAGMVGTLTVQ